MVPRWQLIVSEGPKSGALEVELVLKGCGSIHENLKLALLVHLAALGVDWLQCLLTGKSVWTPHTSVNFFAPSVRSPVSVGTVIFV